MVTKTYAAPAAGPALFGMFAFGLLVGVYFGSFYLDIPPHRLLWKQTPERH
jgi:hypothetical protein